MSGRPSWKLAKIGLFRPFSAFFALFRRVLTTYYLLLTTYYLLVLVIVVVLLLPPPPPLPLLLLLVVRIARPASLAIWHRGRSHRKPNCNESPNRTHFASLDLKKHVDFLHRRPISQDFRREFSAISCDFRSN